MNLKSVKTLCFRRDGYPLNKSISPDFASSLVMNLNMVLILGSTLKPRKMSTRVRMPGMM